MEKKNYKRMVMRRLWGSLLKAGAIYLVLLAGILGAGYLIGNSITWYGTEDTYLFFRWISHHALQIGVSLLAVGLFLIFLYQWSKVGNYFEELLLAMGQISKEETSWITLPEHLKELEGELNQIRIQVQQSRRQAKEAEQRKNDLVVYLAHDLKTPLTSVLGYLTLIQEETEISPQLREKYLSITVKKAERLEELINEFFEITRFNLTAMELSMSSINFSRLLEQTVFEFQPLFKERNLTCCLELEKDIMLTCDPDKIQRVVDNLIRNSILYGYEGTEIRISAQRTEAGGVEFSCLNHGATIPPEKLERIFEQFYRLDSARTTSTGGAGLGLAIAKEIVRLHKGNIWAKSKEEVTRFFVELP